MQNFALTGVAGYIAPRHLQAIKENGCNLVAAMDPHDSVGILDRYFPDVSYFNQFERFDRHLELLRHGNSTDAVDFVSICSPNYLHDAHIRQALRVEANAICEKPLVLNPWNLDLLKKLEEQYGKKIYNILQLRVHPSLVDLKETQKNTKKRPHVVLSYITSRGKWYDYSWKGDIEKSGGIATNIGVHFFDMLYWFYGNAVKSVVHLKEDNKMSGFLELENADVTWYLSIDATDLPDHIASSNQTTYRSITIDGEEVEFSGGFTDLHTIVYKNILEGNGFGIDDARPSIEIVHNIRNNSVSNSGEKHPFLSKRALK